APVLVTVNQSSCAENWQCGDWSTCTNSQQTRTCTDQNSCGTTNSRPPLDQVCVATDSTPPDPVTDLRGQ
ncbi:MAG: hypothetical protein HY567_01040, partial [Candidatus Kerfeldbacteria bacterium]|nr:hypothetical protein [Candidatus Kerfeldbacteria bacterium]